jgi:hypothetical protein
MNLREHRIRLSILAVMGLQLIIFAVRDAQMASDSVNPEDLLFLFAIYAIPFLIFAFMVWTGRWSELRGRSGSLTVRERIALAAEISGAIASGMFLLNLPLWILLASQESFAAAWLLSGAVLSILAALCALAGSPRLWPHTIASALLLPFWLVLAGLLAKAAMD